MVSINYSAREVCCKIVYYGPGLSGKTTNLQYVHAKVPGNTRGKLISLATEADRTLYFDFLPINIGTINDFTAKFQLYTVPGQVYYNATRKLVLRGVDGIVFVADSQPDKMDENIESLSNLVENLREYGYDVNTLPAVIQYNKRDLPGVLPVEELEKRLNPNGWPSFGASATIGNGVFDTLKLIIKLVLDKAKSKSSTPMAQPSPLAEAPAASVPVAAQAPTEPAMGTAAQPTPLAAPTAPAVSAAAQATPEQAPPEAQPAYRPFPGSSAPETDAPPKIAVPGTVAPTQAEELPASTLERSVASGDDSDATPSSERLSTPRMAPPLKRRDETKKRGFFKRVFGIR